LLEQERQQLETEIEQHISDRSQELEQERSGLSGTVQEVRQDQDRVVVAADAFSYASEQGGLSSDSSAIANSLAQSVVATSQAEEQIRSRNPITRFFVGGDDNAARQIEREIEQNRLQIQQLQGTIDSCNCTNTTKDLLRQQLSVMDQEQDRLHNLAQQELSDQGIIGWIWK
jgi:ABC-type Zn uptake system ZnuABC Zn-binding protein ZnuA